MPHIQSHPSPSSLLEWHYVLEGAADTEHEHGVYHGKIVFPPTYPYKPPSISMFTPNGRFATNTKVWQGTAPTHIKVLGCQPCSCRKQVMLPAAPKSCRCQTRVAPLHTADLHPPLHTHTSHMTAQVPILVCVVLDLFSRMSVPFSLQLCLSMTDFHPESWNPMWRCVGRQALWDWRYRTMVA